MNEKRNIPIILLLLAVIVFGVYYLFFMKPSTGGNPWEMMPDTPALVMVIDHPQDLYDQLTTQNKIWKAVKEVSLADQLETRICFYDSLLRGDRALQQIIGRSPLYIALYFNEEKQKAQLLLLSKPEKAPKLDYLKKYLQRRLGPGYAILDDRQGGQEVLKILDGKDNTTSYLRIQDGVLVFTHSRNLMMGSCVTARSGNPSFYTDSLFRRVKRTSGRKVAARVYINYLSLVKALSVCVSSAFSDRYKALENWAQWSELDVLIKDKELIFTGYTAAKSNNLLAEFNNQKPVSTNAFTLFPFNTALSINLGFNNYSSDVVRNLMLFRTTYRPEIKKLVKLTNHEVCYASNALNAEETKNKSWAIIGLKNVPEAAVVLKSLAIKSGYRKSRIYDSHIIRKINIPSLLKRVYGGLFEGINGNYYTILNDYVVFSNSPESLIQLIQYNETGKTLDLNDNFKSFSDNLAERSNVSIILKVRSLLGIMHKYFTKSASLKLLKYESLLNSIQGVALQYSREEKLFYTNLYLKYNQRYKEENLALWKTVLRDEIVGKPFLVKDHTSGHFDIIVFDKGNRMYLINPNGKILWTKRLPDLPISKIYPVDYYKNGKIQFLFNTAHHLFLIDRKGRYVKGYPIRLQPAATNGLSLFDYTKRKDYRILIAQADKQIYDYNIKGNQVRGWIKPRMQNIVVQKVVRLLANNKDYILITDITGKVKIVNRRGAQRIYLKGKVQKAKHSTYYVNRTNRKGIILTTNSKGKLAYISSRGGVQYTDFGIFTPRHYFLYEDFNGDYSRDFIFIDNKKLKVFNRFKKVLFTYDFPSEITVQPEFFTLGRKQKVLGVVASREKTIYLFDKEGNILISSGLTGETPFTVGSLYNNHDVNLITAAGNTLYNYRMK